MKSHMKGGGARITGVPLATVLVLVAVLSVLPQEAAAQTGDLTGQILDEAGEAVPDARVRIVDTGRSAETDAEGRFTLSSLPTGSHVLEAVSPGSGRATVRVRVEEGVVEEVVVRLHGFYEGDELVVTATPGAALQSELYQPAEVLSGARLRERREASLGGTLSREPGVWSTYFGPGAGRPVIRGFGGDRIEILENGLSVGDASATSPDHAVSVEPSSAARIEMVRGPATLLYGSSAVGGAVNVQDGRIAREFPGRSLEGAVEAWGSSVADELAGRFDVTGQAGPIVWYADGLLRDAGDQRIPSEHGHGHDDESEDETDRLDDSAVETAQATAGVSYVDERGHIGVSWKGLRTDYGVPGHAHDVDDGDPGHGHAADGPTLRTSADSEGHGHDDGVFVDLTQRRFDLDGALRFAGSLFQEVRTRVAFSNYDHVETEGGVPTTRVENDRWSVRVEARNRDLAGLLDGAIGVQFEDRDFAATGLEAFVPASEARDVGVFVFQEAGWGDVTFQAGGRYERQRARSLEEGLRRTTDGTSVSLGANWRASDAVTVALSGSRSLKFPSIEELFSDGPHLATRSFELGDPDIGRERALTLDATTRIRAGPVSAQVTAFANQFDDFIFQEFIDEEREGLPVLRFAQEDALFTGVEATADLEVLERSGHHLSLEGGTDYVRAELRDESVPLPRIPPLRVWGGVDFGYGRLGGDLTVRHTARQNRTAPREEPTDGFTMLEASATYRWAGTGRFDHELVLVGRNLTDEFGRSHVSFLRDEAPLPGRDIRLVYRLSF